MSTSPSISLSHFDCLIALRKEITSYLEALQGGKLGTPTVPSLSNAGILHQWLEDLGEIDLPPGPRSPRICGAWTMYCKGSNSIGIGGGIVGVEWARGKKKGFAPHSMAWVTREQCQLACAYADAVNADESIKVGEWLR